MSAQILSVRRTIGEISIDTQTIYESFRQSQEGDLVTYESLTEKLGRDVRGIGLKYSVTTARKMALRELGFVFSAVSGVGLKRLSNVEISRLPESTLVRVRKAIGREVRRQAVVDQSKLSNGERIQHNSRMSLLGALGEFTKSGAIREIEKTAPMKALPAGKVLELFR